MTAKYEKGRKVIVTPVKSSISPRDADLGQYSGRIGVITDYYWIQPAGREKFYIYKVRIDDGYQEVILHEDELQPHLK